MTKSQKQQATNKEFLNRIEDTYYKWRMKKGKHDNAKNLIEFLVRHNFIRETIINRWMALDEYAAQLELTKTPQKPRGVRQIAIWATEELLPLGETQIKANIRNHSTYFRESNFRFP